MDLIKKIVKQTSAQVLGKTISSFTTFISLAFIARNYGTEGTGVYTLALTYLAFFYLFADLGLNGYALQRFDHNPEEANRLFNFRLIWSVSLTLIALVLLPLFSFSTFDFSQSILIGSSTIISFGVINSANLIFQKHLKYERSIIASSIGSLVSAGTILFLIKFYHPPIPFLILGPTVGFMVNVVVAELLVAKFYKFKININDLSYPFEVFKKAWPISATLLINTVYFRIDTFILSSYKGLAEVGIYNLAYQIFQAVLVIPTFIMNAFYPKMLITFVKNPAKFRMQIKIASVLMLLLGAVSAVLVWMLSEFGVNLLSGGNQFEGSSQTLRLLSLSFPAFFLSALYIWVFMTLREFRMMLIIYVTGFVFNLLANFYFVPKFSYIAASLVTVFSEYLILCMQAIILSRLLKR